MRQSKLAILAAVFSLACCANFHHEMLPRIREDLSQMKSITAMPWSIDEHYELIGRPESKMVAWNGIAANLKIAVTHSRPADIDDAIIDNLINQACDPLGWENPDIHTAIGHIGARAVARYVNVIEETPPGGNRTEYFSRGLPEVLMNTAQSDIDQKLIDKIALGLDHPDRATRLNFAGALGVIGPAAASALPKLKQMFERQLKEDNEYGLITGIWPHDFLRWQIESISQSPYRPEG